MLMRVSPVPTGIPTQASSTGIRLTDTRPARALINDGTRSFVPHAAREAGLVGRYRYWQGRSGKRFLFTKIARPAPDEFNGAVLMATLDGEVIWAGDTSDRATADAVAVMPDDAVWFLHLLASAKSRRREIVADLLPAPQLSLGFESDWDETARSLARAA